MNEGEFAVNICSKMKDMCEDVYAAVSLDTSTIVADELSKVEKQTIAPIEILTSVAYTHARVAMRTIVYPIIKSLSHILPEHAVRDHIKGAICSITTASVHALPAEYKLTRSEIKDILEAIEASLTEH